MHQAAPPAFLLWFAVERCVLNKVAAFAASNTFQMRYCIILGQDVHSASVAPACAKPFVGYLEYDLARRTRRTANREKHRGFVNHLEQDLARESLFVFNPNSQAFFPQAMDVSCVASYLGSSTIRRSLPETQVAEAFLHIPTPTSSSSTSACSSASILQQMLDVVRSNLRKMEALIDNNLEDQHFEAIPIIEEWQWLPAYSRTEIHAPLASRAMSTSDHVQTPILEQVDSTYFRFRCDRHLSKWMDLESGDFVVLHRSQK